MFSRGVFLKLRGALLGALSLAAVSCSTPSAPSSHRGEVASNIRIATYNVFTGLHDVNQTVAVIRKMNADVVAMQEIAPRGALLLDHALQRDYRYRYFSNGLAIVSRFPLSDRHFQRSERGINGFLFAKIDHPRGPIQIANVHLDPLRIWTRRDRLLLPAQVGWLQGEIHRQEMNQVMANLRPHSPTVIAGDFNSASQAAPRDLHVRGFIDSFAAVNRQPARTPTLHFSLWGFRMGRRIDYIFHDGSFATVGSQVIAGRPSDHDPVASDLRFHRPPN